MLLSFLKFVLHRLRSAYFSHNSMIYLSFPPASPRLLLPLLAYFSLLYRSFHISHVTIRGKGDNLNNPLDEDDGYTCTEPRPYIEYTHFRDPGVFEIANIRLSCCRSNSDVCRVQRNMSVCTGQFTAWSCSRGKMQHMFWRLYIYTGTSLWSACWFLPCKMCLLCPRSIAIDPSDSFSYMLHIAEYMQLAEKSSSLGRDVLSVICVTKSYRGLSAHKEIMDSSLYC